LIARLERKMVYMPIRMFPEFIVYRKSKAASQPITLSGIV
jgi:hypothetical protein